jgi:hypothetical protein
VHACRRILYVVAAAACFVRIEEVTEVRKSLWTHALYAAFWIIRELRVSLSLSTDLDSTTWYTLVILSKVITCRELKRNRWVAKRSCGTCSLQAGRVNFIAFRHINYRSRTQTISLHSFLFVAFYFKNKLVRNNIRIKIYVNVDKNTLIAPVLFPAWFTVSKTRMKPSEIFTPLILFSVVILSHNFQNMLPCQ